MDTFLVKLRSIKLRSKILFRATLLATLAVLSIFAAVRSQPVTAAPSSAVPAGFVYRCGIHFCLDGHYYYFAGANTYDLFTYGGSYGDIETTYMDKAGIDAQFAKAQADGIMVVRLWMFSHEDWHGFEKTKGVYNESEWSEFDYIIESAKAHDIKLIPVFENYWEAYGGIDTRLSWEGLTGGQPGRAKFFDKTICPGCFTSYKNYVSYALNRVNHYSGIAYKNDPTIFAWELMNEPRYQDVSAAENVSGATLRAWVDEMGAFVKSIDPNHMLDAGLEGHQSKYGFGGDEGNPFVYVQQSPYIDFTSAHPYPDESWANLTIAQTQTLIQAWLNDSHNVVGKPFFMGEWNVHSGTTPPRTDWWTAVYQTVENSDVDGSAFWNYPGHNTGGTFDISTGSAEMTIFKGHVQRMQAKNVPTGPTATTCASCPTATKVPPTNTRTPTATQSSTSGLKVQVQAGGSDNTQQTAFNLSVVNSAATARTNISFRLYFTPDGATPASKYVLEKYYDQSGVATISGPTLASGSTYYFTVNFGTASLAASAAWQYNVGFHLSDWSSTFSSGNDWWHTGYAVGALPASLTDTTYIPAYVGTTLSWGSEPGTTGATNTPTPSLIPSITPSSTLITPTFQPITNTPGTTPSPSPIADGPDLTVDNIGIGVSGCTAFTTVKVSNKGTVAAGAFVVTLNGVAQAVNGLAVAQSVTLQYPGFQTQNTAIADATNQVAEVNETNNSLSLTLVPPPVPACTQTVPPPTKSPTPFTPDPTPLPPTWTPTPSGSLKLQYKAADTNATDNQIKPHFTIVNMGSSAVDMKTLKIRYYFTKEAGGSMAFNCDYAVVGCANVAGTFGAITGTNADTYLELSFSSGTIAANGTSGEIQTRLNKSDWTNFNESNDYSFDPTKINFTDWNKVVLYQNGLLVWGVTP